MKLLEQIERLKYIHRLIEEQQTGSPEEFSKKLYIGKRHLFRLLDELRLLGAPIKYNELTKTYYYTKNYNIVINIKINELEEEELSDIVGGKIFNSNNFLFLYKRYIL